MALRMLSNRWYDRLFWGLIDMAITNSFIIYSHFHPDTTHAQFFEMLAEELFLIAKDQPYTTRPRRSCRTPVTPTTNTPQTPVPNAVATTVHSIGCFKGKYKRNCFYCVKKDNYVLGVARDKDILNPQPSDRHKEFPRRKYGCKTCNVALCHTCWDPYHAEYNGIADTVIDTKKWI